MKLAIALLALLVCCHFGGDHLAKGYADPVAASKALFYILRGIEGVALFAVISILARNRWVFSVCCFGMLEEGETAICRAAKPIAERPAVELSHGLCGEPW